MEKVANCHHPSNEKKSTIKNSSWPRKSSTNSCENCILCHVFSSKNLEFFSNKKSVDHNRFFKMTKTPSSSQFHALLIKKGRIRIFRNLPLPIKKGGNFLSTVTRNFCISRE